MCARVLVCVVCVFCCVCVLSELLYKRVCVWWTAIEQYVNV